MVARDGGAGASWPERARAASYVVLARAWKEIYLAEHQKRKADPAAVITELVLAKCKRQQRPTFHAAIAGTKPTDERDFLPQRSPAACVDSFVGNSTP
jgi:hypothetical protein